MLDDCGQRLASVPIFFRNSELIECQHGVRLARLGGEVYWFRISITPPERLRSRGSRGQDERFTQTSLPVWNALRSVIKEHCSLSYTHTENRFRNGFKISQISTIYALKFIPPLKRQAFFGDFVN